MRRKVPAQKKQKWYDSGIKYLLYSLVIVIPVLFTPLFYTAFSAPKLLALRLITVGIIILWGCKIFVEDNFSYRKSKLNFWLLAYGAVSILTTIFSIAPFTSLFGAQGRFIGLFTVINLLLLPFFIWNFLVDKNEIRILLKISVITASLLAIYGILQYFGIWQEGFNWNQNPAERVFGTIGHSNHFGAYIGMNLMLGLFLYPTLKSKFIKYVWGTGLSLQIITLFLTGSRGALFATIIALILSGLIVLRKRVKETRISYTNWIVPVFLIISITAAGGIIFREDIKNISLYERTMATISGIQEGILPDRASWWLSGADMIKNRPILGYGLSTYRDVYNQYRRLDYQTLEEGDMETQITPEAAHNEYLNIAATQGLIGLMFYLAIIIFVFWRIDKTLFTRLNREDFLTINAIRGALIVYLLQIVISFGVIATLVMFYILLGAGVVMADADPSEKKLKFKGAFKYLVTIVLLFVVTSITYAAVKVSIAEVFYKQGLLIGAKGDYQQAVLEFKKMTMAQPMEYAYYQAHGDFMLHASRKMDDTDYREKLNMVMGAANQYEKAIEINPHHPSTYYNLGVAQFQRYSLSGDLPFITKGAANLEKSVQLAVNNPLYPYQVGRAYLALNKPEYKQIAKDYFKQALEIRNPYRDIKDLMEQMEEPEPVEKPEEITEDVTEEQSPPQTDL